ELDPVPDRIVRPDVLHARAGVAAKGPDHPTVLRAGLRPRTEHRRQRRRRIAGYGPGPDVETKGAKSAVVPGRQHQPVDRPGLPRGDPTPDGQRVFGHRRRRPAPDTRSRSKGARPAGKRRADVPGPGVGTPTDFG